MMSFFGMLTVFLPSKVTVSKSILINATEAAVVKEIDDFKNWKNWYPAFQNRNTAITSQKTDSSFVTLTNEKQRKLQMHMVKSGPESIEVFLFDENKKNTVSYQFILSPDRTGKTRLMWNVNTTLSWYPWKKITGIFLDKITGSQYQEVLQNLKTVVEKIHQDAAK